MDSSIILNPGVPEAQLIRLLVGQPFLAVLLRLHLHILIAGQSRTDNYRMGEN